MTDDEMNAMGAKILKAEMMGNDELAEQLKQKLEEARKAREAGVKPVKREEKEKVDWFHLRQHCKSHVML